MSTIACVYSSIHFYRGDKNSRDYYPNREHFRYKFGKYRRHICRWPPADISTRERTFSDLSQDNTIKSNNIKTNNLSRSSFDFPQDRDIIRDKRIFQKGYQSLLNDKTDYLKRK